LSQKRHIFANFFLRKYLNNHNIGPWSTCLHCTLALVLKVASPLGTTFPRLGFPGKECSQERMFVYSAENGLPGADPTIAVITTVVVVQ
jgi:hypothetical protein